MRLSELYAERASKKDRKINVVLVGGRRIWITCTGPPPTCLRHEDAPDRHKPLRASVSDELLGDAIDPAIGLKRKGHDFMIDRRHRWASVSRHMSVTGGKISGTHRFGKVHTKRELFRTRAMRAERLI